MYIFDYISNDKYEVEYKSMFNALPKEEIMKKNKIDDLNPYIDFMFEIYDYFKKEKLSDNFKILNLYNFKQSLRGNINFIERVSDLYIGIFYYCENGIKNCTLKESEKDSSLFNYYLEMSYLGFQIDHQSKSKPLQKNDSLYFVEYYPFTFKYSMGDNS